MDTREQPSGPKGPGRERGASLFSLLPAASRFCESLKTILLSSSSGKRTAVAARMAVCFSWRSCIQPGWSASTMSVPFSTSTTRECAASRSPTIIRQLEKNSAYIPPRRRFSSSKKAARSAFASLIRESSMFDTIYDGPLAAIVLPGFAGQKGKKRLSRIGQG